MGVQRSTSPEVNVFLGVQTEGELVGSGEFDGCPKGRKAPRNLLGAQSRDRLVDVQRRRNRNLKHNAFRSTRRMCTSELGDR
jgi:hypothetical protein